MERFKNFFLTAAFFAITLFPLFAIMWYTKNRPFYFMDNEFPYWKQNEDFIRQRSQGDYDIVALGDSAANGIFVPQIFGKNFYNLSLGGGTPVAAFYCMQTYLNHHAPPKVAFIAFRNCHFAGQGCFWSRAMYFNYFSTKQEIDFFKSTRHLEKTGYDFDNWISNYLQYKFRFPKKYLPALNNSGFRNRKKSNDNGYEIAKQNRGKYIGIGNFLEKSSALANDCYWKNFKICEINDFYLERLVKLLQQNGVTVIVEQLPFNETSYKKLNANVIEDERNFYKSLSARFGIRSNCEPFFYDDFCFLDGHHLNYAGAAKYSNYICEKYEDVLSPFRADKAARKKELLDYARSICKSEAAVLETLKCKDFFVQIFFKNEANAGDAAKRIFQMPNAQIVQDAQDFKSPIETKNLLISVE